MAKFMFVYRSSKEQHEKEMAPEEMQHVMVAWNKWIEQGMQDGWMVNPGDALKLEGKVVGHGNVISDGPFAESKEIVGGYSVVEAADFSEACEIAAGCPAIDPPGGTIEIREFMGLA